MKQIILKSMLALALALFPVGTLGGTAYAACGNGSTAKDQVLSGIGETGGKCDDSGVKNAISAAVNILSIVVGVAALIMVILSGFKYISSGGESGKVANAKTTLIYALVGLTIAALAQVMVHYVLSTANSAAPLH